MILQNLVCPPRRDNLLLLLLDVPDPLLPQGLLHAVLVVHPRIKPVSVERFQSVHALVGAVCTPVPPNPGGPGQLRNDPCHLGLCICRSISTNNLEYSILVSS